MPMYPQPETKGTVTTKHVLVTQADLKSPPLTAADATTVDATYGAEEAAVINNLRTRLNEVEARLSAIGMLNN